MKSGYKTVIITPKIISRIRNLNYYKNSNYTEKLL